MEMTLRWYGPGYDSVTLEQIRQVIDDDTLSDPQCFAKNKRIICILEKAGSNGGARHDFG